jgi:hypothetical protein
LSQLVPGRLSPGWALLALADAGVPFLVIMDAYESIIRNDHVVLGGVDMDRHIERVSALLELLQYWFSLARRDARPADGERANAAHRELSRALDSGILMSRIDIIRGRIDSLPVSASLMDRLRTIQESIRFFG